MVETYWKPSRTYNFEFRIGNLDLTPDVMRIILTTSVESPYQLFAFELLVDNSEIILQEIFGQKPINLVSNLFGLGRGNIPKETVKFELMYITSNFPLTTKTLRPNKNQRDRVPFTIICVSRQAYNTMNFYYNNVLQNTNMNSILEDVVSETSASLKLDTQGLNNQTIDQVIIPPTTVYKTIMYLDRVFGVFNGVLAVFCLYDNTIYIQNLSKKISSENAFTVWQLAINDKENDKIISKCGDGKKFYTFDNLETDYQGNSAFATVATNMKHIVKPRDKLSQIINANLQNIASSYSLIDKSSKIFLDPILLQRTAVFKDHTGYESDQTFINARFSKKVAQLSTVAVVLKEKLPILNLMRVGNGVTLITRSEQYTKFSGNYVLKGSELSFDKVRDWESSATLYLMRTNRTVN
jgi:hypothetical protein